MPLSCPAWHQGDVPVSESRYPFLGFYCLFCLCVDFASLHCPLRCQAAPSDTKAHDLPAACGSSTRLHAWRLWDSRSAVSRAAPAPACHQCLHAQGSSGAWAMGQRVATCTSSPQGAGSLSWRSSCCSHGGDSGPLPLEPTFHPNPRGQAAGAHQSAAPQPTVFTGGPDGHCSLRGVSRAPAASDCLLGPDGTQGSDFSRSPG